MPFKKPVQKFNAAINAVELGSGEKKIVLGGHNVMPFYTFDSPIENPPRVGAEISDLGFDDQVTGIAEFYAGCETVADMAKRAAALEGVDFICLKFDNADPNGKLLFVEFARVVRESGAGFVDYLWPKPGAEQPVAKISYVQGFGPWGWLIGSAGSVSCNGASCFQLQARF